MVQLLLFHVTYGKPYIMWFRDLSLATEEATAVGLLL